jgi:hypothetical protein
MGSDSGIQQAFDPRYQSVHVSVAVDTIGALGSDEIKFRSAE